MNMWQYFWPAGWRSSSPRRSLYRPFALLLGVVSSILALSAHADDFSKVYYDASTDELVVTMIYGGTNPDQATASKCAKETLRHRRAERSAGFTGLWAFGEYLWALCGTVQYTGASSCIYTDRLVILARAGGLLANVSRLPPSMPSSDSHMTM